MKKMTIDADNKGWPGLSRMLKVFVLAVVAVGVLTGYTGCSSGSGQDTNDNLNTTGGGSAPGIVYSGPAPQTDDVQSFKVNVWDNLVSDNRCGACHSTGGQAPTFVRQDDINAAYNSANTIVDLAIPSNSRMVTKVAGGHNCWQAEASVCGDIITNYISAWAQVSGGTSNVVTLTSPAIKDVGSSKSFPDDTTDFVPLHNLLVTHCSNCHAGDPAIAPKPYFASSDIDVAYEAAKTKIDLDTPANSRFVIRLGSESHNCWGNCSDNASEMQSLIQAFSDSIDLTTVDPALVISKALNLVEDGIVASSGGRVETNVIALYQFKTGSGVTAYDTSGVDPALNLNLIGDVEWLGAWGIRINDGKAQGATSASVKLHDLITATGEYTIEAWVVPDNVTQEGPARIISYSGGSDVRNFTLGQTLYNYNFLNRNSESDANGFPDLSTADAAERLQATLQHVVITYSPVDGRRIYVNGEYTGDADAVGGGTLDDWDDSFALVVGNEVSNDNPWEGSLRLLAVYNRVMSEADIRQNYEIGVGEKFFLLFSVSHLIAVDDAYIAFEVQQFDNYSYLFNQPFFVSLDGDASFANIPLRGMRIGINGKEAVIGQAWATLDTTLDEASYVDGKQVLSPLGSVIALEQGPGVDEFFLSFDQLGDNDYVRVEALPTPAPTPGDITDQPLIGLRGFEEINNSMAAVTGVPTTNSEVQSTFNTVKQQLPTVEAIEGFLAAHQMGVTQLAVKYCSELVNDTGLRSSYFPGFNFAATPDVAFDAAGRDAVVTPLIERLLANELPVSAPGYPTAEPLESQPLPLDIETELENLIGRMAAFCPGTCSAEPDRTEKVVKAACAAAVGSAVILVQ